jgi:hypothetical protein
MSGRSVMEALKSRWFQGHFINNNSLAKAKPG